LLRISLVLLLIVLGITIAAFILAQTQPAETSYLVANQNLSAGAVLSPEALSTVTLLEGSVPGAIPASEQDSVVGRVVSRPLVQGDLVQMSHLCSSASVTCQLLPVDGGQANTLLYRMSTQGLLLPEGLRPGDKVNLFLTIRDPSGPCTSDLVSGLLITEMDPAGLSLTFTLTADVISLIINATETGTLVIAGAPPTLDFQVLSQGTVACPNATPPGSPMGTPTPNM
jgi:Flp pilus assembly protein CpaB